MKKLPPFKVNLKDGQFYYFLHELRGRLRLDHRKWVMQWRGIELHPPSLPQDAAYLDFVLLYFPIGQSNGGEPGGELLIISMTGIV